MPCSKNAKRRSRTPDLARPPVLAAVLMLVLAGCGDVSSTPHPRPYDAPVTAPEPARLTWSYGGGELVLREAGDEVIGLTCFSGGEMMVRVAGFTHIGSEERLSVGVGSTVLTLVATADTAADPPSVKAAGQVSDEFLRALAEGRKVGANYGAQDLGPLEGPSAEDAAQFAAACAG